ncbi:hypothetical protein AAJP47_01015 [Psychrobacter sp. B38]|uniref:hypothetical protein n=1 Tax=Psychrobacter sp. B38 TaxID=3143538 RepID=UPI00321173B5
MRVKKILSYSRYALMILLVVYLILVWMYFKDNARHLTSSGLFLWFVLIPLLLLSSIGAILWWQKKRDKQENDGSDVMSGDSSKHEDVETPDTYQLFIHSRVCLPEGDHWSEVIENDEDLTVLSEDLVDFDGLPILIKPITRLTDATSLPSVYMTDANIANSVLNDDDSDDANNHYDNDMFDQDDKYAERLAALNTTTLRLYSLIHEQLALSDDLLSNLAEYFQQHTSDEIQSNSAIHVHPEWQQHYLVSANDASSEDILPTTSDVSLSALAIYLCLPARADSDFLIAAVKEQLATYGIPETLLRVTSIVTDTDIDVYTEANSADSTVPYDPTQFINEHLLSLSQSALPELCLMIIADTQIDEEWLDSYRSSHYTANVVPTEAGTLLLFMNKAAQALLDPDTTISTSMLLTEICTPHDENNESNKRRYLNHLTTIKNLLLHNDLSLSPTHTSAPNPDEALTKKPISKSSDINKNINEKTNVQIEDTSIVALSDINPSIQPYDISVYLSFVDAFIAKGALVNEHHLGHYMPLNNWLKPFISLSLCVDLAETNQQESEKLFLITQHKQCAMLWLADFSQTSDS